MMSLRLSSLSLYFVLTSRNTPVPLLNLHRSDHPEESVRSASGPRRHAAQPADAAGEGGGDRRGRVPRLGPQTSMMKSAASLDRSYSAWRSVMRTVHSTLLLSGWYWSSPA